MANQNSRQPSPVAGPAASSKPGDAGAAGYTVEIDYTNWRGERRLRRIRPIRHGLYFAANKWHPHKQWLLNAIDLEDGVVKAFSMATIHSWKALPVPGDPDGP